MGAVSCACPEVTVSAAVGSAWTPPLAPAETDPAATLWIPFSEVWALSVTELICYAIGMFEAYILKVTLMWLQLLFQQHQTSIDTPISAVSS